MAGFRARAKAAGEINILPQITIDEKEMEDVQWFHRDFVAARLDGGSTSLMYRPTEEEQEFHIPGKASLAKQLITQWALGK
jgi:NADH pyrophosphatase NudC (nudix superfamily)